MISGPSKLFVDPVELLGLVTGPALKFHTFIDNTCKHQGLNFMYCAELESF